MNTKGSTQTVSSEQNKVGHCKCSKCQKTYKSRRTLQNHKCTYCDKCKSICSSCQCLLSHLGAKNVTAKPKQMPKKTVGTEDSLPLPHVIAVPRSLTEVCQIRHLITDEIITAALDIIRQYTGSPFQGYITPAEMSLFLAKPKKGKRKVQGVPQSQTAALPRHQEEEETDKSKQAQIEQTY